MADDLRQPLAAVLAAAEQEAITAPSGRQWCTERRQLVVEFWLALASAVIICGRLLRRSWTHYRWHGRPRRRP